MLRGWKKERPLAQENAGKTVRKGYTSRIPDQNKKLDPVLSRLYKVLLDQPFKTENILRGSLHKLQLFGRPETKLKLKYLNSKCNRGTLAQQETLTSLPQLFSQNYYRI